MKTLITYKSINGATEKYMKWLAADLNCDICTFEQAGRHFDFTPYDNIIVSSGTYAGFMPLKRFLARQWEKIKGKHVIAVAVGAAPPEDQWSVRSYKKIPRKIRENIEYFKLPGESLSKEAKLTQSLIQKDNLAPVLAALYS